MTALVHTLGVCRLCYFGGGMVCGVCVGKVEVGERGGGVDVRVCCMQCVYAAHAQAIQSIPTYPPTHLPTYPPAPHTCATYPPTCFCVLP